MCGIVGYSGKRFLNKDKIKTLLYINSIERGEDNTGFYSKETGVKKDNTRAKIFLTTNDIPDTKLLISHVRKGSVGGKLAKHSHPFEFTHNVLVHNGTLTNHISLIEEYELDKKEFDVDSEVLAKMIDIDMCIKTNKKDDTQAFKALTKFSGEAALLFHDKRNPNKLYAFRTSGRPLYRGYIDNNMYISSTDDSLKIIGCTEIKQFISNTLYTIVNGSIINEEVYPIKHTPSSYYDGYSCVNRAYNNTYNTNSSPASNTIFGKMYSKNFLLNTNRNNAEYVGFNFKALITYRNKYGSELIHITKDCWYLVLDYETTNNTDVTVVDDKGNYVVIPKFLLDADSNNFDNGYCIAIEDVKVKNPKTSTYEIVFYKDELVEIIDENANKALQLFEVYSQRDEDSYTVSKSQFRPATTSEIVAHIDSETPAARISSFLNSTSSGKDADTVEIEEEEEEESIEITITDYEDLVNIVDDIISDAKDDLFLAKADLDQEKPDLDVVHNLVKQSFKTLEDARNIMINPLKSIIRFREEFK